MKRVSFRVTYPAALAHPIHRRIMREEGVSRMELLIWGPRNNVTTLSWYDADRETVAKSLTAAESITTSDFVESDDGTYAFVHQTEYELPDDVLELVSRSRVAFLPPVTFFEDGDATFEAVGETSHLSEFYARLGDVLDARIERVRDFRRNPSSGDLTDRQRTALETAADLGYYDVPRTSTVEEVADELDCAPSTAGELLRRAEAAVVANQVQ